MLLVGGFVMLMTGIFHIAPRRICPPDTETQLNDKCRDERGKVFPKNMTSEPIMEIGIPLTVIGTISLVAGILSAHFCLMKFDTTV